MCLGGIAMASTIDLAFFALGMRSVFGTRSSASLLHYLVKQRVLRPIQGVAALRFAADNNRSTHQYIYIS